MIELDTLTNTQDKTAVRSIIVEDLKQRLKSNGLWSEDNDR